MMSSDSVKVFSKIEIQTKYSKPADLVMCKRYYLSYCFDLVVHQHTAHEGHPPSNG